MLRFGIIGTGGIADKFARACLMAEGVTAAAVSSRDRKKGEAFAAEHDIPLVFEGADSLVSSDEIDAVYVAVPHTAHFENTMLALKAGKPVLCEKPMCITAAEAEVLFAEAKKRGVLLMEAMWTRLLPNSILAKRWIDEGRIGKVRYIDSSFSSLADLDHVLPRLIDPALAGGALFDVGVYNIEMASYFAGADPVAWEGFAEPYCPGVDASSAMVLKYPGGILATMRQGFLCPTPCTMTIYGTEGRIELPTFYAALEARLFVGDTLVEESKTDTALPKGFVYEAEAFRDLITQGKTTSDVIPPETTIATARVMEDLMKSFFPERK